jgi:hypothetical protein
LGGIQPEPIRALAAEAHDDGLLQRLFPIVLGAAGAGVDKPMPDATAAYDAMIARLTRLRRPTGEGSLGSFIEVPLQSDEPAQELRNALAQRYFAMQCAWESVNKKLASHLGKYDGLFARLCIVFHCIESGRPPLSRKTQLDAPVSSWSSFSSLMRLPFTSISLAWQTGTITCWQRQATF